MPDTQTGSRPDAALEPAEAAARSERAVGRLVTGKAQRYLRAAGVLFAVSMVLVVTFLTFAERQYLQLRADFLANEKVHVVEVSAPATGDLKFADAERLRTELRDRHPGSALEAVARYETGFGVESTTGGHYFVYGVDGDPSALGLPRLADGTAYAVTPSGPDLTLRIPVVESGGGGMTSSTTVARTFAVAGGVAADSPLNPLGRADSEALFVSAATYRDVIAGAFATSWAEFAERYDAGNPYGISAVGALFVHVDALGDVDDVARSVATLGFETDYTLAAFDDIAGEIEKSVALGLAGVLLVFGACAAYLLLSVNSYLTVAHKDMGILRHLGFGVPAVRRFYAAGTRRLFLAAGVLAGTYAAVLAVALLREDQAVLIGANLAGLALLLGAVDLAVARRIRAHASRDVLTLLKADRQFE